MTKTIFSNIISTIAKSTQNNAENCTTNKISVYAVTEKVICNYNSILMILMDFRIRNDFRKNIWSGRIPVACFRSDKNYAGIKICSKLFKAFFAGKCNLFFASKLFIIKNQKIGCYKSVIKDITLKRRMWHINFYIKFFVRIAPESTFVCSGNFRHFFHFHF